MASAETLCIPLSPETYGTIDTQISTSTHDSKSSPHDKCLLSPSSLKQTLLNFSSSKSTSSAKCLESTEVLAECIASPNKDFEEQADNQETPLKPNNDEKTNNKSQVNVMSPESLKQSKLTLESDTDFKKPLNARSERSKKKIQTEAVRHKSVSVIPASTRTQIRKSNASVSPKKSNGRTQKEEESKQKSYHQTRLTNYGVRRTARQYAKDIQRERQSNYLLALRNNMESGMKIIETETKGRGVIATRTFHSGEFIVEYAGDLISDKLARQREAKYKEDPEIGSYMFFFSHAGIKYCVDATAESGRLGRLINHSRLNPNCVMKVIPLDDVPRLALFALKLIGPGEEFLYDYGDRDKESLEAHPWLKT